MTNAQRRRPLKCCTIQAREIRQNGIELASAFAGNLGTRITRAEIIELQTRLAELGYLESEMNENYLDFSMALSLIKQGGRVARVGWNGKGMFIFLVPGSQFTVSRPPLLGIYPEGTQIDYHAHVDMRTANGQIVPWLCSQTDLLANDWVIVENL